MDLNFWLVSISLGCAAYAGGHWFYGTYVAPWRAARAAKRAQGEGTGVKNKPRKLAFKQRSRVRNVQNAVNAGSTQQEAKKGPVNVPNVQDSSVSPATQAGPLEAPAGAGDERGGDFTLTPRELAQLAEALHLYREGATVEAAVCGAFGVSKGGSEGYKRAKALFDAATVAPGAAPAGTYAAPAAPARRRRAAHR